MTAAVVRHCLPCAVEWVGDPDQCWSCDAVGTVGKLPAQSCTSWTNEKYHGRNWREVQTR